MTTNRLEAFSDAVLAIAITIMVLELHAPEEPTLRGLWDETGVPLLAYVLSFVYLGIYWNNNHHHVFQLVDRVSGTVLWANLHLLFWLSLVPFTTNWMAETDLERTPTVLYAVNLLAAGSAYYLLEVAIGRTPASGARYRDAVGSDAKGIISMIAYLGAIAVTFVEPRLAMVPIVAVAVMWLIPDRRIERYLEQERS
ncbi:TMEM175 family protein [Nocardioides sp. P5_C9_2]